MTDALVLHREVCARVPTGHGEFQLCLYTNNQDAKEHLALLKGDVQGKENVLVRIHSECFTGDVLGSRRCDCGEQLDRAMELIAEEGEGVVVYLRQEGRGIGLLEKLHAYNLQDEGMDTFDANLALGHAADSRNYQAAAAILADLGVRSVRLLTNNPSKIQDLRAHGIETTERIPLVPTVYAENERYLLTKVLRMHHLIPLDRESLPAQEKTNGRH
ncbi:MAG: GTP cyclohydrolase II [Chloroflexi bacterium]|jgi:GTP cyclohydrolase II|nr:GTP cyclohydrolase II [Chloroflexota bacterium]